MEGVTEQSTEVELRTFREAIESSGHSIYWTDTNGTIEYVNAAFEEQTGFSAAEAIGNNANILQSGVHDDLFYEKLWDTILAGETWEGEIINERRNNERYIVKQTISPIRNDSGEIVRFVAVNEEITEIREYQEQLEQERDRFEELFNAVPVPLVLTSFEEDEPLIEQINQSFKEQFGFAEQELANSSLDALIADDVNPKQARQINKKIQAGERVQQEVTRQIANGEERTFLLIATPLSEDTVSESLSAYIDITDRKRAEERLKRKNEQLEEFAEVLSHDLRNPLNVAIAHTDSLAEKCESPHIEPVLEAHSRIQDLIENILMLAKQGQTIDELEVVDLERCVSQCWETIATADAELHLEASHTIRADQSRVRQLCSNLIRNAIEHAGDDAVVRIGDLNDGFYVADDGPGIPEAERGEIFQSGYTTSESGTGFGLSIVQKIAEAHDWSVAATESGAGGARFEVTGVDIVTSSSP